MQDKKIEPYYRARAKELVDTFFDAGLFKDGVTRDGMNAVEDLVAFEYQSSANSVKEAVDFLSKLKNRK